MNSAEQELKARFSSKQLTAPVPAPNTVVALPTPSRPVLRSVGSPDVCADIAATELARKHTVTEFSSLTATEPTRAHRDLSWSQLAETVAPPSGVPAIEKTSIPLYVIGALKSAPWVGKTRMAKDAARANDPSVPIEGIQRSNGHVACLDAAVGDVDDRPADGKRSSVWDVSKRLQKWGIAHVAYKSWSGVAGTTESGRIVAPTDRPILPEEYAEFFRAWQELCGNQLDNAGRARSQAYFKFGVPVGTCGGEAEQWRREFDGYVLSVDKMVARGRAVDARIAKELKATKAVPRNESEYLKAGLALAVLPSEDYSLWVKVGAALRREFGENGFDLWREWSKTSSKCHPEELREKWLSFDLIHDTEARLATLHYHAAEAARTILENKTAIPAERAAVARSLAYMLDVYPSDPVHEYLREHGKVPPALETAARKLLRWQHLRAQVEPRIPILYGPGLVQPAMRELASALVPKGRVFVRDGQLVRLVRAGEVLGADRRQSWHSRFSGDTLLFSVIQKPQEIVVEADPWVAMISAIDASEKPVWSSSESVSVPRFRPRPLASELAQSMLHYGSELGFQKLEGVIEHPTLRPDGSILDTAGFDEASGWLYEANCAYPPIPRAPSREDALQALARVADLYSEFPFSDPDYQQRAALDTSSFSAALAALFTRALPVVLDCRKPIFALNGPAAGSGKTTLDAIPALVFSGREPVTHVLSLDPKESKKEILALLLEGHLDITLDNVNGLLDSAELSSLTTADEFSGRILGTTRTARVKPRANWHVNGNGLALKGDLRSRAVWHELDPRVARPDERRFGRDLREFIRSNRAQFVTDVLTILLAYHEAVKAGQVSDAVLYVAPRSRFGRWENHVRKPLLWLGLQDPLGNRSAAFATDTEEEHIGSFLTAVERARDKTDVSRAKMVADAAVTALRQCGNIAAATELLVGLTGSRSASEVVGVIRSAILGASLDSGAKRSVQAALEKGQKHAHTIGLPEKFTVNDLVAVALGPDGTELRDALADIGVNALDANVRRVLGYKLRPIAGRIVGDRRLVRAGRSAGSSTAGGAVLWRHERVATGNEQTQPEPPLSATEQ